MQALVIGLMLTVMLADELAFGGGARGVWWWQLGYGLPIGLGVAVCGWGYRQMRVRPERVGVAMKRVHGGLMLSRLVTVGVCLGLVLGGGLLGAVRQGMGGVLLLPELVVVGLPLGVFGVLWWLYWPLERRLSEARLIRSIDEGGPVYVPPTRGQYVLEQYRHQVLLLVVPMALLVGWTSVVEAWFGQRAQEGWAMGVAVGGGVLVFLMSPLMIRVIWRTRVMEAGALRDRLEAMCERHGVRVRELLLWQTYGGLINGAVIGLVGRLRYILLTDGLIDRLGDDAVEAVMAHELGHVKRRHMPWLAVCGLGTVGGVFAMADVALMQMEARGMGVEQPWVQAAMVGGAIVVWFFVFGWISRRFERQADTFAAVHLSEGDTVTDEGVAKMAGALGQVCALNHVPMSRKSWRHGSMDWRVGYLRGLVGQRADGLAIDRVVWGIKWGCAAMLSGVIGWGAGL